MPRGTYEQQRKERQMEPNSSEALSNDIYAEFRGTGTLWCWNEILRMREQAESLLDAWYQAKEGLIYEYSGNMLGDKRILNQNWHARRKTFGLPPKGAPTGRRGMWSGLNGQNG
jgi:hypothetical protein